MQAWVTGNSTLEIATLCPRQDEAVEWVKKNWIGQAALIPSLSMFMISLEANMTCHGKWTWKVIWPENLLVLDDGIFDKPCLLKRNLNLNLLLSHVKNGGLLAMQSSFNLLIFLHVKGSKLVK